jgi:hypothetical protein
MSTRSSFMSFQLTWGSVLYSFVPLLTLLTFSIAVGPGSAVVSALGLVASLQRVFVQNSNRFKALLWRRSWRRCKPNRHFANCTYKYLTLCTTKELLSVLIGCMLVGFLECFVTTLGRTVLKDCVWRTVLLSAARDVIAVWLIALTNTSLVLTRRKHGCNSSCIHARYMYACGLSTSVVSKHLHWF